MMEKMEKFGCSKSVVGLVIPTGYSFNLDGTTIYMSMAVIFLAQVFNVPITIEQELVIIATPRLVSPMSPARMPKLPGEGVSYNPSLADTLLNTKQLDNFTEQYGLSKP